MQVIKYGIVLESLKNSELELVRNWRNSDHVRPHMEYQAYITRSMHAKWFNSLNNSTHLYFVIKKDKKEIGLINLKDVDWDLKTAEAGIFIGEAEYLNSMIPVLAVISLMELAFEVFGLKVLKAKINAENTKVINFNENIGYQRSMHQSKGIFNYYNVTPENFYNATQNIRKTLGKLNESGFTIVMSHSEKKSLEVDPGKLRVHGLNLSIVD